MEYEKLQQVAEMIQDTAIAASFKGISIEDAVKLFSKKGIEITKEDLYEIRHMAETNEKMSDELSEIELDVVTGGGFSLRDWWRKYRGAYKAAFEGFFNGLVGM